MKKKISILVFAIILLIGMTGCTKNAKPSSTGTNDGASSTGKNTNNEKNKNEKSYSPSELEKNVTSSGSVDESGRLVVIVKNNNKVDVDLNVEAEFYDANGGIAGSDSDDLYAVGAGSEAALSMISTPENFDNYKIYIDAEETEHKSYLKNVEISSNDNGEDIVAQVKNNSNDTIESIDVSVVFYKGDKIIGYSDGTEIDTKSGRSANFTLSYPYDKEYNDIKFDNYKVYLNGAYSYK